MDRTAKLILAAIAVGLWVDAGAYVLRPAPAVASGDALEQIAQDIHRIADCYTGTIDVRREAVCNPYRHEPATPHTAR